jgi:hypothetical protein
MIVGKNGGKLEKATLQLKNITYPLESVQTSRGSV